MWVLLYTTFGLNLRCIFLGPKGTLRRSKVLLHLFAKHLANQRKGYALYIFLQSQSQGKDRKDKLCKSFQMRPSCLFLAIGFARRTEKKGALSFSCLCGPLRGPQSTLQTEGKRSTPLTHFTKMNHVLSCAKQSFAIPTELLLAIALERLIHQSSYFLLDAKHKKGIPSRAIATTCRSSTYHTLRLF